jgi:hypothetical protein
MLTEAGIETLRMRHLQGEPLVATPDPLIRPLRGHLLPLGEGSPKIKKQGAKPCFQSSLPRPAHFVASTASAFWPVSPCHLKPASSRDLDFELVTGEPDAASFRNEVRLA